MKKTVLAATAALLALSSQASAADMEMERQLGLIVSGVVDNWAGVQIIDDGDTDDTVLASGGEGLLSLPLGDNLSLQSDVKYETNERAFEEADLPLGPRWSYQGAVHLSWRDPMSGLFGAFGGMGSSNGANAPGFENFDFRFVGGEGQMYVDNMTFYVQGGYVDFVPELPELAIFPASTLDDGFFVRGVFRWFLDNTSRLQIEGTYLNADYEDGFGDMEAFSVKVRYDFTVGGLPVVGDTPFFVAYRGTFRSDCDVNTNFGNLDVDDHTIMIGTSYSFSGDRLTVDRQGATLDTPDFAYNCLANDQTFEEFPND